MAETRNLDAVVFEIQRTNRLLALLLLQGKSQRESIEILSSAGFQPKEIAEYLGTTANTVNVALSHIRKNARKRK